MPTVKGWSSAVTQPVFGVVQLTTFVVLLLSWFFIYLLPLPESARSLAAVGVAGALGATLAFFLAYRLKGPAPLLIVLDLVSVGAVTVTISAAAQYGLSLTFLLFILLAVHAFFMNYTRLLASNVAAAAAIVILLGRMPGLDVTNRFILAVATIVGLLALTHLVWYFARLAKGWYRSHRRDQNIIARLRQAEGDKTEILSLVSHQLKTPLALIRWSCESVLHNTKLLTKERERLEQSIATTHVMYRTIEDLSHTFKIMAKGKEGKGYLKFERVAVQEVLTELTKEYATVAEQQEIKLTLAQPQHPLHVRADRVFLKHAVVNLVDNAIKYSPAGSAVSVTLKRERGQIKIVVADQGMGIEKANQKRIFERFFRTDRARQVHEHGTGLGLYLVRQILDKLRGDIEVRSVLNQGTTFTISLNELK